jgi:hypothetical protein
MRQPGAPPSCDVCGTSVGNVGEVVHRQMVAHIPYVRDACDACAKRLALSYYRGGGEVIYAPSRTT